MARAGETYDLASIKKGPITNKSTRTRYENKIARLWPDKLIFKGEPFVDELYKEISRHGQDGQETYLGYDPMEQLFYVGYDTSRGYAIDEAEKVDGRWVIDSYVLPEGPGSGVDSDDEDFSEPEFFYHDGYNYLKQTIPNILDLRLD